MSELLFDGWAEGLRVYSVVGGGLDVRVGGSRAVLDGAALRELCPVFVRHAYGAGVADQFSRLVCDRSSSPGLYRDPAVVAGAVNRSGFADATVDEGGDVRVRMTALGALPPATGRAAELLGIAPDAVGPVSNPFEGMVGGDTDAVVDFCAEVQSLRRDVDAITRDVAVLGGSGRAVAGLSGDGGADVEPE